MSQEDYGDVSDHQQPEQLPPERLVQFNLAQCVEWIENVIDPKDRRKLEQFDTLDQYRDAVEFGGWWLHSGLGMALRNACNLWTAGTDEIVVDLLRLRDRHGVQLDGLSPADRDPLNLSRYEDDAQSFAYSLYHPDNCCGAVIEIFHKKIRGDIGIALIERKV